MQNRQSLQRPQLGAVAAVRVSEQERKRLGAAAW